MLVNYEIKLKVNQMVDIQLALSLGLPVKLSAEQASGLCQRLLDYQNHITELQQERDELKNIIVVLTHADETGYVEDVGFVQGFSEISEKARKLFEAHNLEQQAKGIDLAIEDYKREYLGQSVERLLSSFAEQLRNQAKGES